MIVGLEIRRQRNLQQLQISEQSVNAVFSFPVRKRPRGLNLFARIGVSSHERGRQGRDSWQKGRRTRCRLEM